MARVCGRGALSSRCVMGSALTGVVVLLSSASSAHQPGDEFADWFRSLKVPGIERPLNPVEAFCCSPERDCQTTDYETDAPVSTGSRPRASASRYHPIRSCSVRIIRPGAPLPACVTLRGIQLCAASSDPPNPEGDMPQPLALDRSVPQGHRIYNRCVQRSSPTSFGYIENQRPHQICNSATASRSGMNPPGTKLETSRFP
jgi:hypothetical protein